MWFYRRLLRVKRTDKRTNESVLKELGVQRLMLSEIRKRRLKYLGHTNRKAKTDLILTTVLQGKVEAKQNQGRPPTSYIDNVKADSGLQLYEVIHQNRYQDRWRLLWQGVGHQRTDTAMVTDDNSMPFSKHSLCPTGFFQSQ